MGMDSYKSQILDGVLMVLVQKQKSNEPVSQIVQPVSQIFWYKMYTFLCTWAQGGSPIFGTPKIFLLSADCRLVQICIYQFVIYKHVHVKLYLFIDEYSIY
jgi:hypothetical protein